MDPRPFFEFNMLDFTEAQVGALKRFTKTAFDTSEIVDAARDLKYTTEIKRVLSEEFSSPSEDFVRFIIKQVYRGVATSAVREMFSTLTQQALTQFINERIDNRLKSALEQGEGPKVTVAAVADSPEQVPEPTGRESAFSPLEIETLQVVKALVRDMVDVRRVILRRYAGHCSILLDDNRFKIVCRVWVGAKSMRLGVCPRNNVLNDMRH